MFAKCLVALGLVCSAASSFGLTSQGSSPVAVNGTTEVLAGVHTANDLFVDHFQFTVDAPRSVLAYFVEAGYSQVPGQVFPVAFTGVGLIDSSGTLLPGLLSLDLDGSDGWLVAAVLPSAGTYEVVVGGATGASTEGGYYLGAITTGNTVAEPSTVGLTLIGLLASLLQLQRRRRA